MAETLDTTTSQSLINNYKAGLERPDETAGWDLASDVVSGITSFYDARALEKENEKLELEAYEEQYAKNAEIITGNAGSLGEEYYNIAYGQAQTLQQQYAQAVQSDDKKLQGELKIKLNGLSTSVQTLKQSVEIAAEMKSDEFGNSSLSNGRSPEEKLITAVCTDPANLQYIEGEWKWSNPKYDPQSKGSKEFFTIEDLNSSLVLIDEQTSEAYIEYENSMNEMGYNWQHGADNASDFDEGRIMVANKNFINKKNIMSLIHDDFRKTGDGSTFARQIKDYLDQVGYEGLGIDVTGDGVYNEDDYDEPGDMENIMDAITNKTSPFYDYEAARTILAGWMTMHQKKAFVGKADSSLDPDPGETMSNFVNRGGVAGPYSQGSANGMKYDISLGKFVTSSDLTYEQLLAKSKSK